MKSFLQTLSQRNVALSNVDIVKPPTKITEIPKIFLGGSIDMGKANGWQTRLEEYITSLEYSCVVHNPRRDDWDESWKQDPTPGTKFHEQVTWELEAQSMSDILIYNFEPDSKSPITLLELGLYVTDPLKKILVRCPEKFYRYGNVAVVCEKYSIPVYETLLDIEIELKDMLKYDFA